MKGVVIAGALLAAPLVAAQACLYGQCGGINWTGATTCVSGAYCSKINDWYYQCLTCTAPAMSLTTTSSTTTSSSTTSSSTTSSTTTSSSTTSSTTTSSTTTSSSTTSSSTTSSTTTSSSTTSSTATSPTATSPTATSSSTTTAGTGPAVTTTGNPFSGKTQWANPFYASEVSKIAIPSLVAAGNAALATKAAAVADIPSFIWLDTAAKVPSVRTYLTSIKATGVGNKIVPLVVYDLPDRDCAALASNGEYSLASGGSDHYKAYIDAIRATLLDFPEIPIVLVIEPDALANLITNMDVSKCSNAASAYKELTAYAVKQLALPNVSMYLDGGHGGWLGWPANLPPAAVMYAQIYKDAGSPSQLRGLATNVANYNAWSIATCPPYTTPNPNCDEKRYINAMAPALASNGWPNAHFIVDQGRSGKQPTGQIKQGDWCNVIGTGFGIRPDTAVDDTLLDAFVWVKPGGESDGTSNTSAIRYDSHCGLADALQPAPEAGSWFQAYFQQLLENANPSF